MKGSKVWGCGGVGRAQGYVGRKRYLALPTKSCATGVLQCRDLWVVAVVLWHMLMRVSGLDISSSSSNNEFPLFNSYIVVYRVHLGCSTAADMSRP